MCGICGKYSQTGVRPEDVAVMLQTIVHRGPDDEGIYVNGSIGWMHIDTNIFAGWTSGCWWYPYWGYVCGPIPLTYGANTTSYTLGVGGRFEMTEGFFLRAGYERGWTGLDETSGADMLRIDIGLML